MTSLLSCLIFLSAQMPMQRVLEVDPLNNTLTVQAGCILAHVQEAARKVDRLFLLRPPAG